MSEQKTPVVPKSLGFLFADWIAAHCVVPNGYDLGKPLSLWAGSWTMRLTFIG